MIGFKRFAVGALIACVVVSGIGPWDLSAGPSATTKPATPKPTEMGLLAASMKPGTWAELRTRNYSRDLLQVQSHWIYEYTHDGTWDPKTRQIIFLGQGHYSDLKFITYSADTNAWTLMPTPPWWKRDETKGFGPIGHAYDNNAIVGNFFFHQQYGRQTVHRYGIAKGTWDDLPPVPPAFGTGGHSSALEPFPELGGLLRVRGHIVSLFDIKTDKWTLVSDRKLDLGRLHYFAEYNPVRKVVLFGGGNGSSAIYKLNAQRTIEPVAKPPFPDINSTHRFGITVDPVSGEYLVMHNDEKKFYAFDVVKNEWRLLSDDLPEPIRSHRGMIVAPVSTYGVNVFCLYRPPAVVLYKHATGRAKSE